MKALWAQTRNEVRLSLRQGEQLLVALAIPVLLLVFLSQVDVLPRATGRPIDFLAPATMALAVMSASMVSLGIGTGFERHYGVLKRLGATPLGRGRLLGAKIIATIATEVIQLLLLGAVALVLGWQPNWCIGLIVLGALAGTAAFAGLGLLLAGRLSGPTNLAACNALYLILLLFGGVAVPASELPAPLAALATALPSGALVDVMRAATTSTLPAGRATAILAVWAVLGPIAAAFGFRWSPAK